MVSVNKKFWNKFEPFVNLQLIYDLNTKFKTIIELFTRAIFYFIRNS